MQSWHVAENEFTSATRKHFPNLNQDPLLNTGSIWPRQATEFAEFFAKHYHHHHHQNQNSSSCSWNADIGKVVAARQIANSLSMEPPSSTKKSNRKSTFLECFTDEEDDSDNDMMYDEDADHDNNNTVMNTGGETPRNDLMSARHEFGDEDEDDEDAEVIQQIQDATKAETIDQLQEQMIEQRQHSQQQQHFDPSPSHYNDDDNAEETTTTHETAVAPPTNLNNFHESGHRSLENPHRNQNPPLKKSAANHTAKKNQCNLRDFGGDGILDLPHVALVLPTNEIAVIDRDLSRIHVFAPNSSHPHRTLLSSDQLVGPLGGCVLTLPSSTALLLSGSIDDKNNKQTDGNRNTNNRNNIHHQGGEIVVCDLVGASVLVVDSIAGITKVRWIGRRPSNSVSEVEKSNKTRFYRADFVMPKDAVEIPASILSDDLHTQFCSSSVCPSSSVASASSSPSSSSAAGAFSNFFNKLTSSPTTTAHQINSHQKSSSFPSSSSASASATLISDYGSGTLVLLNHATGFTKVIDIGGDQGKQIKPGALCYDPQSKTVLVSCELKNCIYILKPKNNFQKIGLIDLKSLLHSSFSRSGPYGLASVYNPSSSSSLSSLQKGTENDDSSSNKMSPSSSSMILASNPSHKSVLLFHDLLGKSQKEPPKWGVSRNGAKIFKFPSGVTMFPYNTFCVVCRNTGYCHFVSVPQRV